MNKLPLRIIAECHADTVLARLFLPDLRLVNHAQGISDVAAQMQKKTSSETIMIGLIDNDKLKNIPRYFDNFIEFDKGQKVVFKQKEDFRVQHYLLVLDKAIETFLLHNATQIGIKTSDFGLPDDFKNFRDKLKSQTIEDDADFASFLNTLVAQQAPDFIKIQNFISNL